MRLSRLLCTFAYPCCSDERELYVSGRLIASRRPLLFGEPHHHGRSPMFIRLGNVAEVAVSQSRWLANRKADPFLGEDRD
ncbi:hypothetical protein [Mesorhizobium sp.]|uniref:hypothetical protein n=1 Tax=Mesorhizobium sp. TaxID=1871066 RepID=UPI0025EDC72B|nr:hypothetical protein [Mesorhizobium sp.]